MGKQMTEKAHEKKTYPTVTSFLGDIFEIRKEIILLSLK
jgi:hypothetical protein